VEPFAARLIDWKDETGGLELHHVTAGGHLPVVNGVPMAVEEPYRWVGGSNSAPAGNAGCRIRRFD